MRHARTLLAIVAVLAGSCAGSQLHGEASRVREMTRSARDNGAYRCAPRQLALAEAHLEFTETELEQGNYFRAREHLRTADDNARLAFALSPRDRCAAAPKPVAKPVAKGPADKDKDGILDDKDLCPTKPEDKDGFEDDDGCPDPDNDKDGVLDDKDRCPSEPEDKDGFEDDDGCPDPDNDKDGILDDNDRCPSEAEDKDGFEDEDGCPDPDNDKDGVLDDKDKCPSEPGPAENEGCPKKFEHIVVTQEKIELKQKIFFDTAKATIQPRSFALLAEIGEVLKSRASMTVRIEGHTDSRGSKKLNTTLSQARADAVRKHLIGLGVQADRMVAKGFGPDQPIATNKTSAGREMNRRVEFVITQQ